MPSKSFSLSVETKRLDLLRAEVRPRAHMILDKTALDVEAAAKSEAAVDTGALKSSIYVSGSSRGNYEQASSDAESRAAQGSQKTAGRTIITLREVRAEGAFERVVSASVDYALWVELTVRPFFEPAVENNRGAFVQAWGALFA